MAKVINCLSRPAPLLSRGLSLTNKGLVSYYGEGGGGGLQNGRVGGGGEHVKFYPYKKGGAEKVLAMLKGRHTKFWGRFAW